MLPLQYRLKKRKAFNYIYRVGKSTGVDCLTLVYTTSKNQLKVGFSASKKVGNSVMRHRAVRKMREAIRPLIPNIKPDHNLIFVAKDTILTKSAAEVSTACQTVLKKAGLI